MAKPVRSLPALGVSSLLVMFTLLPLSAARSGQQLSPAKAEAVAGYYQAEAAAGLVLAQLRAAQAGEGSLPSGVTYDGACYSYQCPAGGGAL